MTTLWKISLARPRPPCRQAGPPCRQAGLARLIFLSLVFLFLFLFTTPVSAVSSIPSRLYTGQISDPTGLYYYNARYYDPELGIFTSADRAQGPNRYSYVSGNPIMFNDPTGNYAPVDAGFGPGGTRFITFHGYPWNFGRYLPYTNDLEYLRLSRMQTGTGEFCAGGSELLAQEYNRSGDPYGGDVMAVAFGAGAAMSAMMKPSMPDIPPVEMRVGLEETIRTQKHRGILVVRGVINEEGWKSKMMRSGLFKDEKEANRAIDAWMKNEGISMEELLKRSFRRDNSFPPGGDPFVSAYAVPVESQEAVETLHRAALWATENGRRQGGLVGYRYVRLEDTMPIKGQASWQKGIYLTGKALGGFNEFDYERYEVKIPFSFKPEGVLSPDDFSIVR